MSGIAPHVDSFELKKFMIVWWCEAGNHWFRCADAAEMVSKRYSRRAQEGRTLVNSDCVPSVLISMVPGR